MRVMAEITAEDITEQLNQSQAMQLIKEIDRAQCDYDFTLNLARYLVAELKESAPTDEPFNISELE